eukprot:251472-Amphidinium_carterae.1
MEESGLRQHLVLNATKHVAKVQAGSYFHLETSPYASRRFPGGCVDKGERWSKQRQRQVRQDVSLLWQYRTLPSRLLVEEQCMERAKTVRERTTKEEVQGAERDNGGKGKTRWNKCGWLGHMATNSVHHV